MKISFLKKLNNKLPGNIKRIFSPIIRKKLINNDVFLEQFKELEYFSKEDGATLEREQFIRLKEMLVHAYENTTYYKKVFDECQFNPYMFQNYQDLEKIPVISKETIIENFSDMQAQDVNDFYLATTGGSTGTPLKIYLDKKSIYKERAFVYFFWSKYGYDYKKSKVASFRGTDFNGKLSKINPLYAEIQMNPCAINSDTIRKYIRLMDKFGVEFLHGFPSAIYSFCKYAESEGIQIKNKYKAVFLISENVYEFQKDFIEKILNCKTHTFYGHSERAVFAEENGEGYHFNPIYGYVEIDQANEIICTGFINRKMPLIRYKLDDTAIKNEKGYYDIVGHRDGFLYGINDEVISAAMLEVHSDLLDKIANYQFIQEKKGYVKVLIKPLKTISNDDIKEICDLFQERVGGTMHVSVVVTDEMVLSKRGKFKLIVQTFQEQV